MSISNTIGYSLLCIGFIIMAFWAGQWVEVTNPDNVEVIYRDNFVEVEGDCSEVEPTSCPKCPMSVRCWESQEQYNCEKTLSLYRVERQARLELERLLKELEKLKEYE